MPNIVPANEGFISKELYDRCRSEILDVLEPVMDRHLDINDGIRIGMEMLQAVAALKEVPAEHRARVVGAILLSIGSEVVDDLVIVYAEEAAPE